LTWSLKLAREIEIHITFAQRPTSNCNISTSDSACFAQEMRICKTVVFGLFSSDACQAEENCKGYTNNRKAENYKAKENSKGTSSADR